MPRVRKPRRRNTGRTGISKSEEVEKARKAEVAKAEAKKKAAKKNKKA